VIFSPATRRRIWRQTLSARSASSSRRRAAASLACAPASSRRLAQPPRQPAGLAHGAGDELAGLARQAQRRLPALPGLPRERPVERAQAAVRLARTVPHMRRSVTREPGRVARLAGENAGRVGRQPEIGGIGNVGLHDGRVDSRRARHKAPLAHRRANHDPADLVDHVGPPGADTACGSSTRPPRARSARSGRSAADAASPKPRARASHSLNRCAA
jgi:hypothetical protein